MQLSPHPPRTRARRGRSGSLPASRLHHCDRRDLDLPKDPICRGTCGQDRVRTHETFQSKCDLLLQAGGFSAIVLDMAGIAPEHAARVPLATWFRYRAAVERTRASLLLLTQHSCAKSSAELLLRFGP